MTTRVRVGCGVRAGVAVAVVTGRGVRVAVKAGLATGVGVGVNESSVATTMRRQDA
jgi:deoxyinosine 3'endonuclease (endonuclease V)